MSVALTEHYPETDLVATIPTAVAASALLRLVETPRELENPSYDTSEFVDNLDLGTNSMGGVIYIARVAGTSVRYFGVRGQNLDSRGSFGYRNPKPKVEYGEMPPQIIKKHLGETVLGIPFYGMTEQSDEGVKKSTRYILARTGQSSYTRGRTVRRPKP